MGNAGGLKWGLAPLQQSLLLCLKCCHQWALQLQRPVTPSPLDCAREPFSSRAALITQKSFTPSGFRPADEVPLTNLPVSHSFQGSKPANEAAKYRNIKQAKGPHSQTVCKSRTLAPGAEMGSSGSDPSDLGPTGIRCRSDQPDVNSVNRGRTQVIARVILGLYWDF